MNFKEKVYLITGHFSHFEFQLIFNNERQQPNQPRQPIADMASADTQINPSHHLRFESESAHH